MLYPCLSWSPQQLWLKVGSDGVASNLIGDKLSDKQREFLFNEQFSGYDYDNPMIQICQMNMILHGFSHPNVKFQNSTGKGYNQGEEYHVILANPPFAGNLNKSEINEDFSVKTTKKAQTRPSHHREGNINLG